MNKKLPQLEQMVLAGIKSSRVLFKEDTQNPTMADYVPSDQELKTFIKTSQEYLKKIEESCKNYDFTKLEYYTTMLDSRTELFKNLVEKKMKSFSGSSGKSSSLFKGTGLH